MEDYTYHLHPDGHLVLGSHMLEVCESIAAGKPSLEVHPLGIGGKEDPVRLVFNAPAGPAISVSLDRSLSTWVGAFTPAFLNPATQPRTAAGFGVTYSS
jgi:L-arabinose isomerase C-terminal domain/L-arabinose isomerase